MTIIKLAIIQLRQFLLSYFFSFSDPINKTVNAAIVDGVRSTDSTTHIHTIKGT